ncbi:MAG: restriction endonuclease subunit S [Candidatus Nomurabacteria bacterium]|nr:restriction endonuclease subunit S [Candidatus Nomurabacteria bacterium]
MKTLTTKIPKGWEIKKIKEVLSFEQPGNYIVESTAYTPTGKTPVLTANKSFILGYTDEDFGIYTKTPAIIFDDFTTDSKYVDFNFKIKSSAIKILKTIDDATDLKFIYEMIKSSNFQVENHKRHYISQYQEQSIIIPLLTEQKNIANILSSVDIEIQKIDSIILQTEKLKKALMFVLFTKGVDHKKFKKTKIGYVPEEWEIKTFEEFATLQRGFDLPVPDRTIGLYPLVTSNGITDYHNETKIKSPGVVTGRSGTLGNVFYIENDFWPHNTTLYVKDFHKNNEKFVYYKIQNFDLKRFGTGTGVPTLNRNIVHKELVAVPRYVEQVKIAEILSLVDKKILISKKLKNKFIKLKKGLMSDLLSGKVRTIKN